jgi:acyl carrier protein phosphodiesterase
MNYLAHLYVAEDSGAGLVGNLMGDFVKGRPEGLDYPAAIRRGILLHRRVDSFTDRHPVFRQSRGRLSPPFRRFGGIIIDLAYDHFLARDWALFADEPLPQFAQRTYRALRRHHHRLLPRLQYVAPLMAEQDWLTAYRHLHAVERSLAGIARRLSRPTPLADAGTELRRHYEALEADFHAFMPALVSFAEGERERLQRDDLLAK